MGHFLNLHTSVQTHFYILRTFSIFFKVSPDEYYSNTIRFIHNKLNRTIDITIKTFIQN